MSTPDLTDPKARGKFFDDLLTRAATDVPDALKPVPSEAPAAFTPAKINIADLAVEDNGTTAALVYKGQSYPVPRDVALGIAVLLARQEVRLAPILVVQDANTGLVTGVYRAYDADTHDKIKEKIADGRLLSAIEQHYQLTPAEYEVIQHDEPDVTV